MRRLDVNEVIWRTLVVVVDARGALLRALVIPAALIAGLELVSLNFEKQRPVLFGIAFAQGLVSSVLAVSCHRVVLLGGGALPNRWGCYFTRRELRFVGWLLAVVLMGMCVAACFAIPLVLIFGILPEPVAGSSLLWAAFAAVVGLPSWYVMSRASLILPAIAVDERPSLSSAWDLAEGNGWRLILALAVPIVFLWGLGEIVELIVGLPEGALWSVFVAFGSALLGALEVAFLSTAFRLFTDQATGSTRAQHGAVVDEVVP